MNKYIVTVNSLDDSAEARATAQRLLLRLERIEAGEQGWQGTAWALERLHPARFARPEGIYGARMGRILTGKDSTNLPSRLFT